MNRWNGMRTPARWFRVVTGAIVMLGLGLVALVLFPIPILPHHEQLAEGELAEEGSERDLPERRESKVVTQPANYESALIRPAGAPRKGLQNWVPRCSLNAFTLTEAASELREVTLKTHGKDATFTEFTIVGGVFGV